MGEDDRAEDDAAKSIEEEEHKNLSEDGTENQE